MSDKARLLAALEPVLAVVRDVDPASNDARHTLAEALPTNSGVLSELAAAVREAIEAGWIADRESGGIRFSRIAKAASDEDVSIDVVHMAKAGPGHTHPNGEIDLCFAVDGTPRFDGNEPGWTVYPPGSWHIPTVEGGAMDILYFLPGGAIRFEPKAGSQ